MKTDGLGVNEKKHPSCLYVRYLPPHILPNNRVTGEERTTEFQAGVCQHGSLEAKETSPHPTLSHVLQNRGSNGT